MSKQTTIILGNGPAGMTAAIYSARANLNPLVLCGPLSGGLLTTTTDVENFPGFSEGIMGALLMEEMKKQAERFGAKFLHKTATRVELAEKNSTIYCSDEETLQTEVLIIATGASPKMLGLDGEDELMGYGLSTCATCDGAFFQDKEIVVVGGGDSAAEEAIFLTKFASRVRLIHRRSELRASKIMADRILAHPKIEVLWNRVLIELMGSQETGIRGAKLKDSTTQEKSKIECSAIFYAIGHIPNSTLFEGQLEQDKNGYIITAPGSTKTNIPGVFACGDIQDHIYRQAITAAGTGCMAAIEAQKWLAK